VLQYCNTLQHTATHCNALLTKVVQVMYCNTLQRAATRYNALHHNSEREVAMLAVRLSRCGKSCAGDVLQHAATLCNTFKHTHIMPEISKLTNAKTL